ncbi:MAG TPA: cytochrome b/b6 domain-containing protein, partial [Thermoanaerobaculia bacterium]
MNRVRIWDLPVRLFHWLLGVTVLGALAIAVLVGDEGPLFGVHAVLGFLAVFLVLLRIVWGFAGTRWVRFRSLDLRPSSLGRYLREALGPGEGGRHPGHNPATSWFVVATIAIILALGWTGFTMARGSEAAEEVHEILAW